MKMLKNKSTGVEVKILQAFLEVTIDGKFGPKTASALNHWKEKLGMNTDGVMSEADWNTLAAMLPTIKVGNKDRYVKMWQLFLGVTADGIFGNKTKASTKAYQVSADLFADGIVGKQTWVHALTGTKTTLASITSKKPVDYKQYDSRWGNIKYSTHTSSQTIRNSGCGPTSMADIVATWWDKKITPKELCALSVAHGFRTYNSGTAWDFFKFIAEKYGASKFIQTTSTATLKEALKEGAYAIVSFGPSKWTKGGGEKIWPPLKSVNLEI